MRPFILFLPSIASTLILTCAGAPVAAFTSTGIGTRRARPSSEEAATCLYMAVRSRRDLLRSAVTSVGTLGIVAAAASSPDPALARDELFKRNPLTNPVLEKIRILDQDYADNIKYDGELAPGSPKGREAYSKLLVPILKIQRDLDVVYDLVREDNGTGLERADQLLSQKVYEKKEFKKVFNAFADNIYYSDPDRANAYLGGGAVPKNEQSIAYLLRNEILTNLEYLQAEVTYVIKERKTIEGGGAKGPLETEDLYAYSKLAKDSMVRYLELVPPGELKLGKEYLEESKA